MLEMMTGQATIRQVGWGGEIQASDFITGSELAALVGLGEGTLTNDDSPWLMFLSEGKTLFIPRKPIRNNFKWTSLNALGATDGSKVVEIKGRHYRVRLMTGLTTDPGQTLGGEYRNLLMRVTAVYPGPDQAWFNYSTAEMGYVGNGTTNGGITLVKEAHSGAANRRAGVGYPNFGGVWYQNISATNSGYGWRPVLELVE